MMDSKYISHNAILGKNVYVGDFVKILGSVKLGDGTYVDDFVQIGYPHSREIDEFMNRFALDKKSKLDDFICKETTIGNNSRVMIRSIISAGSRMGDNFFCGPGGFVGADNEIGNNVRVHYGSKIHNGVTIGNNSIIGGFVCNDCIIGKNVTMLGYAVHKYKYAKEIRPVTNKREPTPRICDFAVVGFNAVLIGDITIGEGAVIGAGAIVTKDVEPYDTVAGNPALSIKDKCSYPK